MELAVHDLALVEGQDGLHPFEDRLFVCFDVDFDDGWRDVEDVAGAMRRDRDGFIRMVHQCVGRAAYLVGGY